jgi:CelD/BcsL family acetyltransferase involved in cellulose biosynthesis
VDPGLAAMNALTTIVGKYTDMPHLECLQGPEAVVSHTVAKTAYRIDPFHDLRWNEFIDRHPEASLFHSLEWLRALSRTYGYRPLAYTTAGPDEELRNAVVFCRVESWLTGRRLVSLPFSDHCQPLVDTQEDLEIISTALEQELRQEQWRYLEMRPLQSFQLDTPLPCATLSYSFHELDLRPDLDTIFRNFHKSSIQRKIRRAEREALSYCEGSTEILLNDFYALFKITRRRHGVPPQPRKWFANLIEAFGDDLKIRVAYKDTKPVAAILTLRHKNTLIYKYGGCDARFNRLGGMHCLFWKAIQEAKAAGLRSIDFGRADADQRGLITFKNRWGAKESLLTYLRYGDPEQTAQFCDLPAGSCKSSAARFVLRHLPISVLSLTGLLLYPHVG